MKLIAHRGNTAGRQPERENTVSYLKEALDQGYEAECDVIFHNGKMYLGHDKPQEILPSSILLNKKIWFHAKDISALQILHEAEVNCFFHHTDAATITSKGFIWLHSVVNLNPEIMLNTDKIIQVMPRVRIPDLGGYCTDNVKDLKLIKFIGA